ncbi:putative uracil DNA glycosylase protein [Salipiger bermudensis HTCC2601]|uniref:Putative uracil DNA glycosylase protein n=1 Tax=Salipiger bermudensis (strain DSM 26914 / JCM 13377 / KCTC 12554 / HTCC2601) TaxID=314265 RepID=Q0FIR5_SALBH|nr:putative uracil DNA glycosylase protein [Salipiger bermudensis HTCC2601]
MRRVVLPEIGTFEAWRDEARALLGAGVPPEEVLWNRGAAEADLFAKALPPVRGGAVTVPKGFVDLARLVVWHRDPERFARLYALLWALGHDRRLLEDRGDPRIDRLRRMAKEVSRDRHKMTAFVRFREIGDPAATRRRFAAWFEPSHYILELAAPSCQALRGYGLVDLHARSDGAFRRVRDSLRPARGAARAARRRRRGALAHLLPQHLQSRTTQGQRDAGGDAEEILAQPARGAADSRTDRRGPVASAGHGRRGPEPAADPGRAHHRAAARPRGARAGWRSRGASDRAGGLPALPALAKRDPAGGGRGPARCGADDRGRAARRSGGSGGAALRRARGAAFRRGGRARRAGARPGLCHQRGEAFQVRAARQAAAAPVSELGRDRPLPVVARHGAPAGAPEAHRGDGGERGGEPDRRWPPHRHKARHARAGARRHAGDGDMAPVLSPASSRGRARRRRGGLRGGSAPRRRAGGAGGGRRLIPQGLNEGFTGAAGQGRTAP